MNLHLERRLEVLAREIAEAKKPRINTEESRLFAEVGQRPYAKTLSDLRGKPVARTVDDVFNDPTDAEREYIMNLRGGCGCMHPPHRAPCSNCETPYTEAEAAEALAETSDTPSPASETETEGLIEGAIYRVKFPSGNVWLSRWQNGEWWGSSDLTRPDVLKNKKMGGQNGAGVYECLGLEWKP